MFRQWVPHEANRSAAALYRIDAATKLAKAGTHCVGVGFRYPVIVRKEEFMATSACFVCLLLDHAGVADRNCLLQMKYYITKYKMEFRLEEAEVKAEETSNYPNEK